MRDRSRDHASYELAHGLAVVPSDDPETELFIEETIHKVLHTAICIIVVYAVIMVRYMG